MVDYNKLIVLKNAMGGMAQALSVMTEIETTSSTNAVVGLLSPKKVASFCGRSWLHERDKHRMH